MVGYTVLSYLFEDINCICFKVLFWWGWHGSTELLLGHLPPLWVWRCVSLSKVLPERQQCRSSAPLPVGCCVRGFCKAQLRLLQALGGEKQQTEDRFCVHTTYHTTPHRML